MSTVALWKPIPVADEPHNRHEISKYRKKLNDRYDDRNKNRWFSSLCFKYWYLQLWQAWLNVLIMSRTRSRVNLHSIVAWMSKKSLLKTGALSEV